MRELTKPQPKTTWGALYQAGSISYANLHVILRNTLLVDNNFSIRQRTSDTTITPSNSMVTSEDYDIVSQRRGFLIYNHCSY